jgi:tetratricopeptide (TPR) repeat protein
MLPDRHRAITGAKRRYGLSAGAAASSHLRQRAQVLFQSGRHVEAEVAYRELAERVPDDFGVVYRLALLTCQLGRPVEACAFFQRATQLKGVRDAQFHFNFGFAQRAASLFEAALENLDRALSLQPDFTPAAFQKALCLRGLSRLDEAEALYRNILSVEPSHTGALLNLANLSVARGSLKAAECLYQQLLAVRPNDPEALLGLGNVAVGLGQHLEALSWYRAAGAHPAKALVANINLGTTLKALGRREEAVAHFEAALALNPANVPALSGLVEALESLGRVDDAVNAFEQIISIGPHHLAPWTIGAELLDRAGRAEQAIDLLARAERWHLDSVEILAIRAQCLNAQERFEDTVIATDEALDKGMTSLALLNARGTALQQLGHLDRAIDSFSRALELDPSHPIVLNNLGNAYRDAQRWAEAIDLISRAIELKPDYADAFYNRAVAYGDLLAFEEGLRDYDQCIALNPDHESAHFNRAIARLTSGCFGQGWAEYEWRWRLSSFADVKHPEALPLWRGVEPLEGRSILVYAEQGLGDTLQFVRLLRNLKERGARVLFQAQDALLPLLQQYQPIDQWVNNGDTVSASYRCPLLSLPHALGLKLDDLPIEAPYLSAPRESIASWSARLGEHGRLRIGLCWSGNSKHANDRNRSLSFAQFVRALPVGPDYLCVQREIRSQDRAILASRPDIRTFDDWINDFADTAALTSAVDLVISVDTSVAHLAGALGRPLWMLLHYVPDFRWLLDRSDSPWYPSARLIRQPSWGDWDSVLSEVHERIIELQAVQRPYGQDQIEGYGMSPYAAAAHG